MVFKIFKLLQNFIITLCNFPNWHISARDKFKIKFLELYILDKPTDFIEFTKPTA